MHVSYLNETIQCAESNVGTPNGHLGSALINTVCKNLMPVLCVRRMVIQGGSLEWTREEALASVQHAQFLDLPLKLAFSEKPDGNCLCSSLVSDLIAWLSILYVQRQSNEETKSNSHKV